MATKQETAIVLKILEAVAEAIRELGIISSGHLYTSLISVLTFDQYNKIIGALKTAGLVEETHHLLKWIGPKS